MKCSLLDIDLYVGGGVIYIINQNEDKSVSKIKYFTSKNS
jgi:hypothetical protein